jgi:MFS family permease
VLALGNVGPLLGAVAAPRWTVWLGFGRGIVLAALLWAGALAIPLASPHAAAIPLLVLAFFVGGFGTLVVNVGSLTLRQAITPDELLGRVTSAMRLVIAGTLPFGAVFAGVVASAASDHAAVWVAAAGVSLAFLLLLPLWRVRET